MAYKYDGDLEFLREMKDEDLNGLVDILIYDKDGETRWSENLTTNEFYKKYNPQHQKYLDVILEEFQKFGGHTAVNALRGSGVLYREILCDVCDKCKVNYNKKSSVATIEQNLLMKILQESVEKMNADELKELGKELNLPDPSKQAIMSNLCAGIATGFLFNKRFSTFCCPPFPPRPPRHIPTGHVTGILVFTAALWAANDLAGPAYRVTIPAVIQIAFLRQEKLRRDLEEKSSKS